MNKTYEDGIRDAGVILDELFSMDEKTISELFDECTTPDEVIYENSVSHIIDVIQKTHAANEPKRSIKEKSAIRSFQDTLRQTSWCSQDDIKTFPNGKCKGTIIWYDGRLHKGLIAIIKKHVMKKVLIGPMGKSITAKNSLRKRRGLRCGDLVEFDIVPYNGKVYADNIEKYGHVSVKRTDILLPVADINTCASVSNMSVTRYGKQSAVGKIMRDTKKSKQEVIEQLTAIDCTCEDVEYVYINTPRGEYRIFPETSPIKGDGHVKDLDEYLLTLDKKIFGIKEGEKFKTSDENDEDRKKKMEKPIKITGLIQYLKTLLMEQTFSSAEIKEIIRYSGMEKKLKKGAITMSIQAMEDVAPVITGRRKPKKKTIYNKDKIYKDQIAACLMANHAIPKKEAKQMVENYHTENDLNLTEKPEKIADKIAGL